MVIILNFLEFGRAVVCEEDEFDQTNLGLLGICLGIGCVMS